MGKKGMIANSLIETINTAIVVDYVRVRKSNIKELQEMMKERKNEKLFLITLLIVPALVLAVAITGLIAVL